MFLGLVVRFYNIWRLRKYEALAEVSVRHRQALEHHPSVTARRDAEVPFGIRAIQSGIQVDGVWISGSNTPIQSGFNSRAPSMMLDTDPSNNSHPPERAAAMPSNPRLEIPQPAHRQSTQGRSSTASRDSTAPHGRSSQMERSSNRLSTDYLPRGRPTYQPRRSSGLRYSNIDENSDALDALEGRRNGTIPEAGVSQGMRNFISRIRKDQPGILRRESHELSLMPPNPGYLRMEHSSGNSNSSSSGDEQQRAPRRPPVVRDPSDILYDPASLPRNQLHLIDPDQRSSFDALAHHRRSQGAEEGHLLPRIRLSHTAGGLVPSTPAEHRYVFEEPRAVEHSSDPFVTPLGTPMGSPIRSVVEPPSFASFVNSTPLPDHHTETLDDSEETSPSSQESAPPLQHSDGNRQLRQSHVVRKVNPGFEIVHPGSFNHAQRNYAGDWNRDLEKGNDRDLNTTGLKRGSKRLQRKRADSKESRFTEQVN